MQALHNYTEESFPFGFIFTFLLVIDCCLLYVRLEMWSDMGSLLSYLSPILGRPSVPEPQPWGFLCVLASLSHSKET